MTGRRGRSVSGPGMTVLTLHWKWDHFLNYCVNSILLCGNQSYEVLGRSHMPGYLIV